LVEKYKEYFKKLPVMPEVANRILSIPENHIEISFQELENIIKIDPALCAKVLKVANSAQYARPREIKSLQMAITLLGFKTIKSFVLLYSASNMMPGIQKTGFYKSFWRHSVITAFLAKAIIINCQYRDLAEIAFLSGLFHDIGQPAFFLAHGKEYMELHERASQSLKPIEDLEEEDYQTNHKDLGASILESWNFPEIYIHVANEHESLNIRSHHKMMIIYTSIADIISMKLGYALSISNRDELLKNYLLHTHLKETDQEYYEKEFLKKIKEDALFCECQELFGF